MKPRFKKLGQNFLKNQERIKKIVDALELKTGDTVIEIGPGHGEITRELIKNPGVKVIAIEKDVKLAKKLQEDFKFQISNFKTNSNGQGLKLKVIEGDVLKILPQITHCPLQPTHYKLVGNIPFYLTGYLLRTISELEHKPDISVFVLQKEVAERLASKPPKMNLLAASVQFWARPEIIGSISKKDFRPRPAVDAAIVRLSTKKGCMTRHTSFPDCRLLITNYYKIVKILFKQPRKTILNNLLAAKTALGLTKGEVMEKLSKASIDPQKRGQNLGVKEIKELTYVILYNV